MGGSKDAFDLVALEQSGLVTSHFVSRIDRCLSGLVTTQVTRQLTKANEPRERREQLVAEVLASTFKTHVNAYLRHQPQRKAGHR